MVWSESSLPAWRNFTSMASQNGPVIWIFAWPTWSKVRFLTLRPIWYPHLIYTRGGRQISGHFALSQKMLNNFSQYFPPTSIRFCHPWDFLYFLFKLWSRPTAEVPLYSWNQSRTGLILVSCELFKLTWAFRLIVQTGFLVRTSVSQPRPHSSNVISSETTEPNKAKCPYGASMGRGNQSLFAAPGLHYHDSHPTKIWLKTVLTSSSP